MSGGGCYRDVAATGLAIRPLSLADLPRVLEIERLAYSHPWSEGVFQDCFKDSYRCWALSEELGLVGYAIVNYLVDEAHLLNLCVAPDKRRLGGGRCLLRHVLARARAEGMVQVLLEEQAAEAAVVLVLGVITQAVTTVVQKVAQVLLVHHSLEDQVVVAQLI